ncbi:hypothetical protein [Brachybacterium tyrofermentans]|uniref:Uncharacterized protein n=1 Tax=Brachybacterium tyrofermentans TaxID=47848 RepID=A0ABW0FHC8_9MICO
MDDEVDPTDSAGEAVCWIGLLCPECGAMPEGEGTRDPSVPCWRCGAVRPTDPDVRPTDPDVRPTGPDERQADPDAQQADPQVRPTDPDDA